MKSLIKEHPEYKNINVVLRKVYAKMRNVYGVCFEQEYNNYCKRHNITGHISNIEIVSDKQELKSLFSNILNEMRLIISEDVVSNITLSKNSKVTYTNDHLRTPLTPLIKKYNDISTHSNLTFRKVYKQMENMGVNWHNRQMRYIHKHHLKNCPLKSKLINENHNLYEVFCDAINVLLAK